MKEKLRVMHGENQLLSSLKLLNCGSVEIILFFRIIIKKKYFAKNDQLTMNIMNHLIDNNS